MKRRNLEIIWSILYVLTGALMAVMLGLLQAHLRG